jgi:S1-C subfamily serine protease
MAAANGSGTVSELLGFRGSNSSDELARQYGDNPDSHGVYVVSIDPSGPAYQAGMREGDLIHAVNRQPVRNTADLDKLTGQLKQGDYVLFQVERSGSMFFIAFRL